MFHTWMILLMAPQLHFPRLLRSSAVGFILFGSSYMKQTINFDLHPIYTSCESHIKHRKMFGIWIVQQFNMLWVSSSQSAPPMVRLGMQHEPRNSSPQYVFTQGKVSPTVTTKSELSTLWIELRGNSGKPSFLSPKRGMLVFLSRSLTHLRPSFPVNKKIKVSFHEWASRERFHFLTGSAEVWMRIQRSAATSWWSLLSSQDQWGFQSPDGNNRWMFTVGSKM